MGQIPTLLTLSNLQKLQKNVSGSVTCTMTRKLYHSNFNGCFETPNWFDPLKYSYGPRLGTKSGTFFYWDSSEMHNFPAHNPCNSFSMPQNLDFKKPRGAIYLY